MATLKKSKLDVLLSHIAEGGNTDEDTVAEVLGLDPDDTETISAYIARASKAAPEPEKPQLVTYHLKNDSGILTALEVIKEKNGNVILQIPVVKDIVTLLIKGEMQEVDLEVLRKLGPDALHLGVKVSTLLAAAELAKG